MIETMLNTVKQSGEDLRKKISNVRYQTDGIAFDFDGKPYLGKLRGRNEDLILGCGEDIDAGIALRVYLDKDAQPAN